MRAAPSMIVLLAVSSATTAWVTPAWAELTLSAQLSQDRVYVGEVVTLEVTAVATGDGNVDIDIPVIPGLEELRRGHSDSTSISWTGAGQTVRRERTLRVDFEARKAGTLTIPPIEARLGSESRKTPPLRLTVGGEDSPTDPPPPGQLPQPGQVTPPDAQEAELFVRYRVDKPQAYVGEQILLDLDIFTNGAISLDEIKPPIGPDGFWREIIERSDRLVARVERVGGREYRVYRLWRIALFGIEPGERTLPSTQLTFSSNRSVFSAGQRLRRSTPAIKVEILPLPPMPRPGPLAGVGLYTLEASVDQANIPAGKGVLLSVVLAGAGNVGAARLPELKAVDGFRVFPPRITDDVQRTPNGVTGSRRAEILLVPTRAGRLEIPALSTSAFDPDKRTYETLTTAPLMVTSEGAGEAPPEAEAARPEAAPPDRATPSPVALRPIRFPGRLDGAPRLAGTPLFWGLLSAPLALWALVALVQGARARPRAETSSSRARRQLDEARARLEASGPDTAYADASEAVLAAASARVGVPLRGHTVEDAARILVEGGAEPALVERFKALLRACDQARFAPGGGDGASRRAVTEARALVEALASAEIGEVEP